MSMGNSELFGRETELLKKAQQVAEDLQADSVSVSDYNELISSYADLLKQISLLTRISDKNQKRTKDILKRLSRYVPPPIYRKITSGKETVEINKTRRVKLSIFFSDIKGFSWLSSDMQGEALSAFLNSYLEEMTHIVNRHGGTLDKYIGDAIMVFFGDPDFSSDEDHALRCVQMAVEMRSRMRELQEHWFNLGYPEPLHIRMGISTGFVNVGNFGSHELMDYTIIGAPVNLASRLQENAQEDQILISHETWGYVKTSIPCSPPFNMELKGFYRPILVHEVQDDTPAATQKTYADEGWCLQYNPKLISLEEIKHKISHLADKPDS